MQKIAHFYSVFDDKDAQNSVRSSTQMAGVVLNMEKVNTLCNWRQFLAGKRRFLDGFDGQSRVNFDSGNT